MLTHRLLTWSSIVCTAPSFNNSLFAHLNYMLTTQSMLQGVEQSVKMIRDLVKNELV